MTEPEFGKLQKLTNAGGAQQLRTEYEEAHFELRDFNRYSAADQSAYRDGCFLEIFCSGDGRSCMLNLTAKMEAQLLTALVKRATDRIYQGVYDRKGDSS